MMLFLIILGSFEWDKFSSRKKIEEEVQEERWVLDGRLCFKGSGPHRNGQLKQCGGGRQRELREEEIDLGFFFFFFINNDFKFLKILFILILTY